MAPPPLPYRPTSLLGCFAEPQTSILGLQQYWNSQGLLSNVQRLCQELETAVQTFITPSRTQEAPDSQNATQERLADLKFQLRHLIRSIDIDRNMRLRVLYRSTTTIDSWLEEFRSDHQEHGDNSEEEHFQLKLQPCFIITSCILIDPFLAFVPYKEFMNKNDKSFCALAMAKMGADLVLTVLLDELRQQLKEQTNSEMELNERMYHHLSLLDGSRTPALLLAAQNEHYSTMELLLKCNAKLVYQPEFLNIILSQDLDEVFKVVINHTTKAFDEQFLCQAIKKRTEGLRAVSSKLESSYKIVLLLLSLTTVRLDKEVAKLVVEAEDPELWNNVQEYCDVHFEDQACMMLHDAVFNRRVDIVSYIVRKAPMLSVVLRPDRTSPEARRYALWYNSEENGKKAQGLQSTWSRPTSPSSNDDLHNSIEDQSTIKDICQEIKNLIVPAVIRSAEPFIIRQIFRQSNVAADNICLSLSSFNTSAHDFKSYVNRLVEKTDLKEVKVSDESRNEVKHGRSNGISRNDSTNHTRMSAKAIKFEKILRYADFPDLDAGAAFPSSDDYEKDNTEVLDVLKWLETKKGVREIVEIKVSDRLYTPHYDKDAVQWCVDQFRVKILNWKKLDLCLVGMDPNETLEELYLYSSGSMAVIYNWLSRQDKGGVIGLRKLKKLHIFVVEDVLSKKRATEIKDMLEDEFKKLKVERKCTWSFHIDTDRFRQKKIESYAKDLKEIVHNSFPEIEDFIEHYKEGYKAFKRDHSENIGQTKICLIDSGVIVVENDIVEDKKLHIGKQIAAGESFVFDEDTESPWWHASVPHGTQMASLLCSIDPCCELYIAKVGDNVGPYLDSRSPPVTPERVAEAVEWAITKKVDIILLCLVMTRETSALKDAFDKAKEKKIIVICSTADAGRNWRKTWPSMYAPQKHVLGMSGHANIIRIGACDKEGFPLNETQDTDFPFLFKGKDVYVGPVPFVDSQDRVTGSSVATAIAAGIASLTLNCCRLANNSQVLDDEGRYQTVLKKFKNMTRNESGEEPAYVLLDRLISEPKAKNRFDIPYTASSDFHDALEGEFGPHAKWL